jgi:transposase-like protein
VTQSEREVRRRLAVLAHAQTTGNVSKTCRFYAISRDTFYEWKRAHGAGGERALVPRKPGPKRPMPNPFPPELLNEILRLRRGFHFGAQRIV